MVINENIARISVPDLELGIQSTLVTNFSHFFIDEKWSHEDILVDLVFLPAYPDYPPSKGERYTWGSNVMKTSNIYAM